MTEEHKRKIGLANKGRITWAKGKHWKLSEERKKEISKYNKKVGKIPPSRLGIKVSEETRKRMSLSHQGERAYNWKGGIENARMHCRLRRARRMNAIGSFTLGEWETLKAQYNWTCPRCKKREPEIKLGVDHIIPLIRGGSNNIENIQPLCRFCNSSKKDKIIKFDWRNE